MGDFRVRKIKNEADRHIMYRHALEDIEAFEHMLAFNIFEDGPPWIGAEQELCIVDNQFNPTTSALDLLNKIDDKHYTNELALFNMEINLDPLPLKDGCFSNMESSLIELLKKGSQIAKTQDEHILMTGILRTLKYHHLQPSYMTPIERYQTLSQALSDIRGSEFEVYLQGVDDLIMSIDTILFEACNTSFQLHLQIRPDEFVNQHNWSQKIAGPVLSACVNAPMLFGNELWAETRIALFKQSMDTRSAQRHMREKLPRVYFGSDWLRSSPVELWKNDIMRFPLIVTSDDLEDSKSILKNGGIPDLRGIRLHNGTTYTWNRMCYGYSKKKPHLRIECRYLPAGPSAIDEIANFAFWVGLMRCEPEGGVEFWKNQDFKSAKDNFLKAARYGLNTVFSWYGENIPAKQLILEKLIPMSRRGLATSGVRDQDIDHYLAIIEKRVSAEVTGASWTVENFRILANKYGKPIAEKELVDLTVGFQEKNIPIHEWPSLDVHNYTPSNQDLTVEQMMTTSIYAVNENDSIELVKNILDWNQIHHLPVENRQGNLVGLITDGKLAHHLRSKNKHNRYAKDIMLTDLVTISSEESIKEALDKLNTHGLSALPVTFKNKLIGILTKTDLAKYGLI